MGVMTNVWQTAYVAWEEVVASYEKGRREVHYFLKRRGGGRDLVVVGKEKRGRHMMYDYAIQESEFLLPVLNRISGLKLRARRDVIDWLNSLVSDGKFRASSRVFLGGRESKLKTDMTMGAREPSLNHRIPGFAWLGSSRVCQRRRNHYESFSRLGAVISIQDFVYVLAEENKRLVAYIEDMYEDFHGNKTVLVRWFHRIDEVGFDLPSNYNDREIFFSLSLQEVSVECIDGHTTVLSPEHYEKLSKEAMKMGVAPFLCCRQFDNYFKPFEVTSIEGYWKQDLLRKRAPLHEISVGSKRKGFLDDALRLRPDKKFRRSSDSCMCLNSSHVKSIGDKSLVASEGNLHGHEGGFVYDPPLVSCIEVLSLDSGIRGCWFRALIIKKRKDMVKVKYQDIKDAVDDSKNLEEWILPSRIAAQDSLGVRLSGRPIIRPAQCEQRNVYGSLNVGSIVDAWRHDGWWEGIVMKKESPDKITVYFPGEDKEATFCSKDLRPSKEWFENRWQDMDGRPDIAAKFCGTEKKSDVCMSQEMMIKASDSVHTAKENIPPNCGVAGDLSKDSWLSSLRWISSGKKRYRRRSHVVKTRSSSSFMNREASLCTYEKWFASSSLRFDSESCKYARVVKSSFLPCETC